MFKTLISICLFYSVMSVVLFSSCRPNKEMTPGVELKSVSVDDDVPGCSQKRTKPLLAFSLWSVTPTGCDPRFRPFLNEMRQRFKSDVVEYQEFPQYYDLKWEAKKSWMENRISDVIDLAVPTTPGCPMMVFNLHCFDADQAFQKGCGTSFDPKAEHCVTAFEINHILSKQEFYDSTVWFQGPENTKMAPAELKEKFEKYFPNIRY